MSEQTANLCTTDACESLRQRLAKYEDAEGRPLHIDVNKAARALCNRHADICGVDREDQWKTYSQDFIEDAATVLAALKSQPSGVVLPEPDIRTGRGYPAYSVALVTKLFARLNSSPVSSGDPEKCSYQDDPRSPAELSLAGCNCVRFGEGNPHWPCKLHTPVSACGVDERAEFEREVVERYGYTWASIYSRRQGQGYSAPSLCMAWIMWKARAALSAPSHGGGVAHTDCRSEDGITVGLIDSIITSCRVLSSRDLTCEAAVEALRDLRSDSDVSLIKPSHGEQVRDNRAEFKREERYMVVKLSKLADDLGGDELSREEQIYRLAHFGKALVECVVVESDWPEYEPTWAAIKARVTGSIASNQLPGGWAAKPTDDGEGFIISSPRVNGVASHFSVFPDSKDYASCALWKMLAAAPSAGSQGGDV